LTFVLATAKPGVPPRELAARIQAQTGLRARASDDFKADTARWFLINSEDVGDIAAMLSLAMSVGFGVTGIMLYMFTRENLKQYAVLKAMGATSKLLLAMVFVQTGLRALLGTGIGRSASAPKNCRRPVSKATMSFSRKRQRNRRERTRTDKQKPGRQATRRRPSSDSVSAEPHVWRTDMTPMRAPKCLGSAAIAIIVSDDALNRMS
jgi:FtsX-like permease family protein